MNGDMQTATGVVVLIGTETNLAGSNAWYLVPSSLTNVPIRVTIGTNIFIILEDGCDVTFSSGIEVPAGKEELV